MTERPDRIEPDITGDAYSAEMRDLKDYVFLKTQKYTDCQMRADRRNASTEILDFEKKFIKRTAKIYVPMFAHCVVRSSQEQNSLFVRGLSKARAGSSAHNYGMAVDLVHCTKAWDLTKKQWDILGHIGKEVAQQAGIKITWGGDWKFYDPAHWELQDWRSLAEEEMRQSYLRAQKTKGS